MQSRAEISFHADRFLWRFLSHLNDRLKETGLPVNAPDAKIIFTVKHHKTIAISQLVKQLGRDKSQVSRKVQELEEKGILTRETDPENSRISLISLTSEGETLVRQMAAETEAVMAELLQPLEDSEQETLRRLLSKISASRW